MEATIAASQREPNSLGITDYSVLMQIRSRALNDLQNRIPADYHSTRTVASKLAIYESENLDRIRHLARVDFNLAKELAEENDKNPVFTPREVSATEVLGLVGYCLMFLGLDEEQRTPHNLGRMRDAESALRESLNLYVLHLDEDLARPIRAVLAASNVVPAAGSTPGDVAVEVESPTSERFVDEMPHEKNRRRWQMCIDAGLTMPDTDYKPLPKGIGLLAKKEGISQQAFSKSVKAHLARRR